MPQMAPLSWLLMFIIFSLIFILFNIINFYNFIYTIKKDSIKKYKITPNWKW